MAAQDGALFLLKIGDGGNPETFTAIGGGRSHSIRINNEIVDATTKDSNKVRELLAGGGVQSLQIQGSGVFIDDAAFGTAETAARNRTVNNYQVIVPGLGTYEGSFLITDLELSGDHNGEVQYSLTLESAGAVTFTAA